MGAIMKGRSTFLGMGIASALGLLSQTQISHAAPPAPVAFNWSGYYLGGNVGVGWRNRQDPPNNTYYDGLGIIGYDQSAALSKTSGFTGGVGFGYNLQFNRFVFGIDYEFQWAALGSRPNYSPRYFARQTGISEGTAPLHGSPASSIPGTPGSPTYTGYTALNYNSTERQFQPLVWHLPSPVGYALDRYLVFRNSSIVCSLLGTRHCSESRRLIVDVLPNLNRDAWGWVGERRHRSHHDPQPVCKWTIFHMEFGNSTYVDPIASTAVGTPVLYHTNRTAGLGSHWIEPKNQHSRRSRDCSGDISPGARP